jgi:hypothetical protein
VNQRTRGVAQVIESLPRKQGLEFKPQYWQKIKQIKKQNCEPK